MKKTIKRWRLPVYLVLLVISNLVSYQYRTQPHPEEDQRSVVLDRDVTMAFRDHVAKNDLDTEDILPVILLHGSPMAGRTFNGFPELMDERRRVLIVDLPGFGGSLHQVADYSVAAHADYVHTFMAKEGIERAHILGYSQSGGVGIHLADAAPEKVASLTMMSAIGVQELELLGDYGLNQAVYSAQLAVFWGLYYLTPHMGLLDRALLNYPYARNFKDTDQRPLREMLLNYEGPMLIVQGREDTQVPLAAAEEHARIVPQAETFYYGGGHIAALIEPELILPSTEAFWRKVERGEGVSRASASPERLRAAERPFVREAFSGPGLFVIMALIAIAVQASEDLALIGAGLLVSKGVLGLLPALAACYVGMVLGDCYIYLLGRFFGRRALRKRPLRWFISQKKVDKQSHRFKENMFQLIFTSRFIPGARVAVYFAAGMLRTGFFRFTFIQALAALIWVPLLVGVSALFGQAFLEWFEGHKNLALVSIVLVIVLLWILLHKVVPLVTWRGRRMFLSSWYRRTRWEFWPRWMFYPPVVIFMIGQMIKYRSWRMILVANPGMMYGGFARESKHTIFEDLQGAGEPLLPWTQIPVSGTIAERMECLGELGKPYPLVLKPDIGYRGQGVGIVGNEEEAIAYLNTCPVDVVAQPMVQGVEFGVFYIRHPDESTGRVTSITGKDFPVLVGDGERTIEELILTHDRAICMAPFFMEQFGERVFDVPDAGDVVPLTQLGTHCRGAIFLDRSDLLTPELEAEIDRISQCYEGFYLGRYDLCASSEEDFKAGRGLKILELNGLTAESAHIYDPKHSVFYGWKTVIGQWRKAFSIAAANRAAGHKPDSYRELFKIFREFFTETNDYEAPISESMIFGKDES